MAAKAAVAKANSKSSLKAAMDRRDILRLQEEIPKAEQYKLDTAAAKKLLKFLKVITSTTTLAACC